MRSRISTGRHSSFVSTSRRASTRGLEQSIIQREPAATILLERPQSTACDPCRFGTSRFGFLLHPNEQCRCELQVVLVGRGRSDDLCPGSGKTVEEGKVRQFLGGPEVPEPFDRGLSVQSTRTKELRGNNESIDWYLEIAKPAGSHLMEFILGSEVDTDSGTRGNHAVGCPDHISAGGISRCVREIENLWIQF